MTFDLLQGHMIQYGHQTLFQSTKVSNVIDHVSKILEIFCSFIFFCFCFVLFWFLFFAIVLSSIIEAKKKKKVTSIPLFDFRIQWNSTWLDSSVRSKVEVITGCGHIGLRNPTNFSSRPSPSFYNTNKTQLVRAANLFTAHEAGGCMPYVRWHMLKPMVIYAISRTANDAKGLTCIFKESQKF